MNNNTNSNDTERFLSRRPFDSAHAARIARADVRQYGRHEAYSRACDMMKHYDDSPTLSNFWGQVAEIIERAV